MRVCAINGSLRGARGVTHKILQHMCAGITRAGGSWNVIHLAELMIDSCRACNHCQKTKTFKCIIDGQDDAEKVFTQMMEADVLIYATPVYLFGISSLLKRLLERIYSRAPVAELLVTKSGLFFHATDPLLTCKPFVSVVVCNSMEGLATRNIKDYFRIYGRFMDAPQVAHLERRSAAAWITALGGADVKLKSQAESVVRAYEQAGHDLVIKGSISKVLKRATEQKFIKIPLIVRLARHVPMLRRTLDAKIRKRSSAMTGND